MIAAHAWWLTGDAGGGGAGGEGGWIYWHSGNTNTLTGLNIIHCITSSHVSHYSLVFWMRENIIYRDEVCDSLLFPGLAASSQGPTRMLS